MSRSLLLTLQLDNTAQAFYEGLRRRYFPPERNLIAAHLTLFHQLPDEDRTSSMIGDVAEGCAGFLLTKPMPRSIGRGVAVFFRSEQLSGLHAVLSNGFKPDLIPQDRQRFQPHIVVQNKVDSQTARHTLAEVHDAPLVEPRAVGFTLWVYLGGPWGHLRDFPFR